MRATFDRTATALVRRPWTLVAIITSLTLVALVGYVDPFIISRWWLDDDNESAVQLPRSERPIDVPDVNPADLTSADAVLVVEGDQFFSPRGAEALRSVVDSLEQLPHVASLFWMDRVPILNIFGLREPLFPNSHASQHRFDAARDRALRHPLVVGQFLSQDCRTVVMLVRFDWLHVRSDAACSDELRDTAIAAMADFPELDYRFRVTGHIPMYLAVRKSHEENHIRYQVIGYSMIALMAVILFRGVAAVIVVALAPALGVFWTLGIIRFFDLQNNPFSDVVLPVLLSLVGLTDGVHLMVQIRRLRSGGKSGKDAAVDGVREVGLACALTSVTTAIGFGSLSLAHHEIVREFGWCCVLGVVLTFVAVVTVIPLACYSWLGRRVHVGHGKGWIDQHFERIGEVIEWVLRYPRRFAWVAIGASIVLTAICLTLEPDERNWSALPSGSEAAQAMYQMDRALGGLETARVEMTWDESVDPGGPRILEALQQIDVLLRQEPLLGHPISLYNLVESLPGDGKLADRVSLVELLPPPLKRAFYQPEQREAIVRFRVQNLGIAAYSPVFQHVRAELDAMTRDMPGFTFRLEGGAVWRWENLYQIVVDLAKSLGTAIVIIFGVLAVVYRSWRLGLISIVPNIFPLAVTGTYLALSGQSLEIVSVCAFTVCLGIAVDDTIHFLTRYEEERRRSSLPEEVIRRAFVGVGTALIMTTLVLVAGFATVSFSDARDHRIFAAMGGLTISSALFADLIFLPALLAVFHTPRARSDNNC